jgi:hypothetical protein
MRVRLGVPTVMIVPLDAFDPRPLLIREIFANKFLEQIRLDRTGRVGGVAGVVGIISDRK